MTTPEIKRSSLADAFKGAGAEDAADLAGLLPRRKSTTQAGKPVPAHTTPPTTAALAPVERPAAAPIAAAEPVKSVSSTSDAAKKKVDNVPAYVDAIVLAAVRAARREGVPAGEPEKTYDELLVDALEVVPLERIRAIFTPDEENAEGGLMQRRQRRTRGGGGTQIQLRMSKAQEEELAGLTESVGAPSRSAFVTAVYRLAYLKD